MKIDDIFNNLPLLETERLVLRKMTLKDAEDLFEYASHPYVARYVMWDFHKSIQDSINFLRSVLKKYEEKKACEWGIVYKENNKLIGTGGFTRLDVEHSLAEIGYALSREYWNRGLGTEAVKEIIKFGFEKMCLNRIEARCMMENIASQRVLEKVGMRFEGILRKQVFAKGKYIDLMLYSILREEYYSA